MIAFLVRINQSRSTKDKGIRGKNTGDRIPKGESSSGSDMYFPLQTIRWHSKLKIL